MAHVHDSADEEPLRRGGATTQAMAQPASRSASRAGGQPSATQHAAHAHDGGELVRFSVAMPEELLIRFDSLVARRGVAKNRSEMVRDLVREALIREESATVGTEVMGTLTIVFDHHSGDLQETLHHIQHANLELIISTTHVHLDESNCLEVIILRGETTLVHDVADMILGTKGVKNGGLVVTTTGQMV